MRVLLITPPLTQLNTPYPATLYLKGFLEARGYDQVSQADASLEFVLKLLSRAGLTRVLEKLGKKTSFFTHHAPAYLDTIDGVVRFLQGKDPTLAYRIASRSLLPEGPRFGSLSDEVLYESFGGLSVRDRAQHLASLYIDDLADVIREGIDPRFELSRYGEKLAASQPSFEPMMQALGGATLLDEMLDELTHELYERHHPDVVGFTAPFPGNVYAAFRMAREIKRRNPACVTVLGGGYANTELRELPRGGDPRIAQFMDFITFDDGEAPLLALLEALKCGDAASTPRLLRTVRKAGDAQEWVSSSDHHDVPQVQTGFPTAQGLRNGDYLQLVELLNPMHRLWSDGRWNKLTLAHGCYWKKCNFCDVSLDYIGRYENVGAALTVDRMERLIGETGCSGFHFVDEAAPPAALRALAQEILKRGLSVTWWGNVRFEKAFTPELCELLARSGCIAFSGGLEVASDRLLTLMNKGVTVEQVARVTHAMSQAGIQVHAYLMFGFPTQTNAETIDALERVRQLFEAGCIQSAFWHRFSATAHSPIGRDPACFGIKLKPEPATTFARNDLEFSDPTPAHHDLLGLGLKRALYNYMQGAGWDHDVRHWFVELKQALGKVPQVSVPHDLIERALAQPSPGLRVENTGKKKRSRPSFA